MVLWCLFIILSSEFRNVVYKLQYFCNILQSLYTRNKLPGKKTKTNKQYRKHRYTSPGINTEGGTLGFSPPLNFLISLQNIVVNDVSTDIKNSSVILMILLIHELIADIKDSSVILMILLVQFSQCYSFFFFFTNFEISSKLTSPSSGPLIVIRINSEFTNTSPPSVFLSSHPPSPIPTSPIDILIPDHWNIFFSLAG